MYNRIKWIIKRIHGEENTAGNAAGYGLAGLKDPSNAQVVYAGNGGLIRIRESARNEKIR